MSRRQIGEIKFQIKQAAEQGCIQGVQAPPPSFELQVRHSTDSITIICRPDETGVGKRRRKILRGKWRPKGRIFPVEGVNAYRPFPPGAYFACPIINLTPCHVSNPVIISFSIRRICYQKCRFFFSDQEDIQNLVSSAQTNFFLTC